MTALPRIMVAPNGATKTKADHPALPITLDELTNTARACQTAGAQGLHFHLRTPEGTHLLDSGAYREALGHLAAQVPGLALQITTEAAGIYHPPHQRHIALHSGASLVSVSLREMLRDGLDVARRFYLECAEAGIAIQHICYDRQDAENLARVLPREHIENPALQLLFVLGRYTSGQASSPEMLAPFTDWMRGLGIAPDWAVCAFGIGETAALTAAATLGGKMRVGFENSLWHANGKLAANNAARVEELYAALA
nr:3-keto-5-aminohexanoate cleavage protein [uncultured Celeribacter sp.]